MMCNVQFLYHVFLSIYAVYLLASKRNCFIFAGCYQCVINFHVFVVLYLWSQL